MTMAGGHSPTYQHADIDYIHVQMNTHASADSSRASALSKSTSVMASLRAA